MRISRLLAALAVAITTTVASTAQQPPTPQQPQTGQTPAATTPTVQPSLADAARKTVAFVTVLYSTSSGFFEARGTGFFVSIADKRFGSNQGFGYLVTNRHVAQPGIDLGTPHDATQVRVRVNLKTPQGDNGSLDLPVPLGGTLHWYFPKDNSVDLAVMPVTPSVDMFDYMVVPSSLFATEEQIKSSSIDVGDQVFFTGFFSSFPGQKRIEPIVRQGILAMMPDEPIQTTLHKPGRLYLADAHAFHGNSGSPVFVSVGGMHRGAFIAGESYLLIGIISGYFPESAGYTVPAATVLTGEVHDNSGIAALVPADELMKLLSCPELQALRDQEAAKLPRKP